ncbi:DUF2188 domain-containing protein [Microbacterium paludicola]|uniref:DUF2188 domain-containing protein n=1 Tax=Microbacterium paludicola TaxID=300019 RepID=UPI0031E23C85
MADYHVTHDKGDDNWKVTRAGGQRASASAGTQADAVARANQLAGNSGGGEVNIHRKDNGQIRDKNTIGKSDPHPPKG